MAKSGDSSPPWGIHRHRRSIQQPIKLTLLPRSLSRGSKGLISRGPPFTCLRGASWVWTGGGPAGGAAVDLGPIWMCSGGSGVRIPARQTSRKYVQYTLPKNEFFFAVVVIQHQELDCLFTRR